MLFFYLLNTTTTASVSDQSIQSILGLFTVLLGGGSVVGIAINKMFDAKNIKIIVELQSEIKSLQREIKYRENDLNRIEVENAQLREQITILQEKSDSNFSEQLTNIQEKYGRLMEEHKKAVIIINKFRKKTPANDTNV